MTERARFMASEFRKEWGQFDQLADEIDSPMMKQPDPRGVNDRRGRASAEAIDGNPIEFVERGLLVQRHWVNRNCVQAIGLNGI